MNPNIFKPGYAVLAVMLLHAVFASSVARAESYDQQAAITDGSPYAVSLRDDSNLGVSGSSGPKGASADGQDAIYARSDGTTRLHAADFERGLHVSDGSPE